MTEERKGVFQPNKIIVEKKGIAISVSYPERKWVRYRLARIMNNNWKEKDGLKEKIESQFVKGMNWNNFMQIWDVDQKDPYKVIEKEE